MKKRITSLIFFMIVMLFMTPAYAENLPALPEMAQEHYVIYREGTRDNRIEAVFFDVSDGSAQSLLWEQPYSYTKFGDGGKQSTDTYTQLTIADNEKYCNDSKWYLEGDTWIQFESGYNKISENATELIGSDLPYFEVAGKTVNESYGKIKYFYNLENRMIAISDDYKVYESEDGIYYELINDKLEAAPDINVRIFAEGNGIVLSALSTLHLYTYGNLPYGTREYWEAIRDGQFKYGINIYDENFNLINIAHAGFISVHKMTYEDGYFYMHASVNPDASRYDDDYTAYYKTTDGVTLEESSAEEYYKALYPVNTAVNYTVGNYMFYNGGYSALYQGDSITGIKYESREPAWRSSGKKNRGYIFDYGREGKVLSVDGFYGIDLPLEEYDDFWYRDGYYYIETEDKYYRIKESLIGTNMLVKLRDTYLAFDQPPIIENDRTLVPMRFLFEQMGATVDWNDETKTATATLDDTSVTFAIDKTNATVNGESAIMDVPARLVNGKTMVPLRFLSEELGYSVTWDENTSTAVIE